MYAPTKIFRRENLSVKNPTIIGAKNQGIMAAKNTAPTQLLGLFSARLNINQPSAAPSAHEEDSPTTCPTHMIL